MSDRHHERFELSRFVLDFLEQQGGIVAPPAFGAYEVLMSEEIAASLGVDDLVHLRFDAEPAAGEGAMALSINHPVVDKIAALVAQQPANAAARSHGTSDDRRAYRRSDHEDRPVVVAFVMRSTNRVLATRAIELTPKGIYVSCQCEKTPCPKHGYYYRPALPGYIDTQVGEMLLSLQKEYLVPGKKVDYYYMHGERLEREGRTFELPATWRDPVLLAQAMRGFDTL